MGDHLVQYIGKSVRVRRDLIHITYLNFFCSTSVDSCNSWLFLRSSSLSSSLSISLEIEIIVCIIVVWTNKDKLQHSSEKRDSCLMKSSSKQSIHIKKVRMSSDSRPPMRISQLLALKSGRTIWIPWEHQVCLGLFWPFWVHPRPSESTWVRRGQPGSIWIWQNHLEPGRTTRIPEEPLGT